MTEAETKEELIEQYRYANVEYEGWWEFVYEDFKEDMRKNHGIDVHDITFSGFWSQGDGAEFTGKVFEDRLFMTSNKLNETYPNIFKAVEVGAMYIRFGGEFRRHPSQTSNVDIEDLAYFQIVDDPDMNEFYQNMYEEGIRAEFKDFEIAVQDLAETWAHELYKTLEESYEWLTSDEQVWDTIVANEWHL